MIGPFPNPKFSQRKRPLLRPALLPAAALLLLAASAWGAGVVESRPERAKAWVAVLKQEPDNAEAMVRLGEALMGADRLESARKMLEKASAAGNAEADGLLLECGAREGNDRPSLEATAAEGARLGGAEGRLVESLAKLKLGDVDGALAAAVAAGEALGADAGEELQWRVAEQLEECAKWAKVFSLVE